MLKAKVEKYYVAVDNENWDYTYQELDSQTQDKFTQKEWYRKNQWIADHENLELASMVVQVNDDPSSNRVVSVTVRRTFKNTPTEIERDTYFVYQDEEWKHRFSQEENNIFMPFDSYKEFTEAQ